MKLIFTKRLLEWNESSNTRKMPWKGEKDPYKIWLSEIILQQTRVEQGLAYYNRFISAYPTVNLLAGVPEQEVFKLWEGLGYYSRCKNLIATAKLISTSLEGKFPDTYENIRALKGIGPYTAAAISSFAFGLPYAVVDGNVLRVLSRYFGITKAIDSTEGKKLYNNLAEELLDREHPAIYNQAIMDFGAIICKAQQPLCNVCVQQDDCKAYKNDLVKLLPVKEKSLVKKTRWFYYFIVEYKNHFYIRKRNNKDIWENLYEFVLKESGNELVEDEHSLRAISESLLHQDNVVIRRVSKVYTQKLTHQTIQGRFITLAINKPAFLENEYQAVLKNDLDNYPFPKIIANWLLENKTV
jgi:A/G-specific adenine glycosylase